MLCDAVLQTFSSFNHGVTSLQTSVDERHTPTTH